MGELPSVGGSLNEPYKRSAYPLDAEGYHRFVEAYEEADFEPAATVGVGLMLFCGLRISEATHAAASWFTETEHGLVLRVPSSYPCYRDEGCSRCRRDGSRHDDVDMWMPKTDGRQKDVIGSPHEIPVPNSYVDHHIGERVGVGFADYVQSYFDVADRVALSFSTLTRRANKLSKDAGLELVQGRGTIHRQAPEPGEYPNFKPHDLRASWAVQALRSGVNGRTLQHWAGWDSYDMVDHYAKFVDDANGEERSKF